jgi:hypothetical protein
VFLCKSRADGSVAEAFQPNKTHTRDWPSWGWAAYEEPGPHNPKAKRASAYSYLRNMDTCLVKHGDRFRSLGVVQFLDEYETDSTVEVDTHNRALMDTFAALRSGLARIKRGGGIP